jgi:hypothetical protein
MTTPQTFTFKHYTDPGHGWVAVKKKFLEEIGIADQITSYSYMKGQTAYLEEDQDASTLYNTLKGMGHDMVFLTKNTNKPHPIRSYEMYKV